MLSETDWQFGIVSGTNSVGAKIEMQTGSIHNSLITNSINIIGCVNVANITGSSTRGCG